MHRKDDPNPLSDEPMDCKYGDCQGTIVYCPDDNVYRCISCDFELSYDEMKLCDLKARQLLDQYPDLDPDDL